MYINQAEKYAYPGFPFIRQDRRNSSVAGGIKDAFIGDYFSGRIAEKR
jgi:hypothetical protein